MRRVRIAIAVVALSAAIAAQGAGAQETPELTPPPTPPTPPAGDLEASDPSHSVKPKPKPRPEPPKAHSEQGEKGGKEGVKPDDAELPPLPLGTASCGTSVPSFLIPIYQEASDRYGLGPVGPAILAAINEIESGFGANMGPSSAGAIGWMQFMPSTWAAYGVDANGDGKKDPWDAEDAIFGAANYLRASGMPEDPEGA